MPGNEDDDIPYEPRGNEIEHVHTLLNYDCPTGVEILHAHCGRGVVSGQILSAGWGPQDTEHFTVKEKGSIKLTPPTLCAHAVGSPVTLIMLSPGGRLGLAGSMAGSGGLHPAASRARSPCPASSDIPFDDPAGDTSSPHNRSLKLPSPLPPNHHDVLPWHVKVSDGVCSTNPKNQ